MADGEVVGAGAAELTGGDGGGTGEAVTPQWVADIPDIPDELKTDPTIVRLKTPVEALKSLLHHKQVASTRLAVPGKDAKPEDWAPVYDALGRPKTAAEYDFALEALPADADEAAKTARAEMTGRYAELFHPLGLNSQQAAALVKADVARIEAAQKAWYAKGEEEIGALKTELGADYEPQKEAAKKMFVQIFGDDAAALADELDTKVGSGRLMRGMMKLSKVAGEHSRVDGGGGELTVDGNDPQAQLNAKMADKSWRDKYNAGDVATVTEYNKLLAAATTRAAATA